MQITKEQINSTTVKLTIQANTTELTAAKQLVLERLARRTKLPGFRPGHAPLALVERQADATALQADVLDEVLGRLYDTAVRQEKLRPVGQPKLTLQKFVPYSDLAFSVEVEAVGDVKLPDYKKFKLAKTLTPITEKDIEEVINNLQLRLAEKKAVERAAAKGDEVTIDFTGLDAKTTDPIKGADGKGYPLVLGSDAFIPGFEANLIGVKAGEDKTFTLTFPKDYGVKALQNRAVVFTVRVHEVQELTKPLVDDAFAAKVGPFKTAADLRADIRRQLEDEKRREADRTFENQLVEKLGEKSTVAIPQSLIDEEVDREVRQVRQNLTYRGQTWKEFLDEQAQSEEEYLKTLRPDAEKRVRAGLALSEVAEQEGLTVTLEELQIRLQVLKSQYKDKQMQAELEKPENVRSILSTMLTEKTLARLTEYVTAK